MDRVTPSFATDADIPEIWEFMWDLSILRN